jgi:hypothetical protein
MVPHAHLYFLEKKKDVKLCFLLYITEQKTEVADCHKPCG